MSFKFFSMILISITCVSAFGFTNPAIDREIENVGNSESFISELQKIKKQCSENVNLKFVEIQIGGATKKYWYEYVLAQVKTDKTIIFLPGGPGAAAISSKFLPKEFNKIQIDPRGVGCNFGTSSDFALNELTTEKSASDVLNIIRAEDLSQYLIYGHSYGTVMATILARQVENLQVKGPVAVVLEGTFGRAFSGWSASNSALVYHLNKEVSVDVRRHLSSLNLDRDELAFAGSHFAATYDDDSANSLVALNKKILSIKSSEEFRKIFEKEIKAWQEHRNSVGSSVGPNDYVLNSILCHELSPNYEPNKIGTVFSEQTSEFRTGVIRQDAHDICDGSDYLAYDSAKYLIKAPIYYFQGDRDVSTSVSSAKYHFESQTKSEFKIFSLFLGRGHSPLQLDLRTCTSNIFSAIFEKRRNLSNLIYNDGTCVK